MLYTVSMGVKKFRFPSNTGLLILFLISSVFLNIFLITANRQTKNDGVPVIGVIDGDTLVLEGKSLVRLRHIDAPEDPYCGSSEAKKILEQLVMGKKVRLEEQIPDQYGRGMALVYAANKLINLELIRSGWVRYHHDISTKTEVLKQTSVQAKEEKLGIYGSCQSTENTKNPKCVIKGNIDKSTDTHIYYLPNCAQYAYTLLEEDIGESWFCTEKEAIKAGFSKAQTCK